MRLICPHCMSAVTVPDDAAGKETPCPNCGKPFATPARYTAAVSPDVSAPPPGYVPPAPAQTPTVGPAPPPGYVLPSPALPPVSPSGFLTPQTAPAEVPAAGGYTRFCGITFSPNVVAWLPAVFLTATLLMTFFPWVGCYAGSSAVFSQRPWGAMFGSPPSRNFRLEAASIIPGGWIDRMRGDWQLLAPFFLLLFVAIAFAWSDRGFRSLDPRRVAPMAKLWPYRSAVVAACAGVAFALLVAQVMNGFSMERAIRQQIAERFAEQRAKAANSPEELAKVEYAEDQAFHAYNVEHTTWLYLALLFNLLAVAAVLVHVGLDQRGNKPPPKLLLHY
jgi:hypothetical protein